MGSCLFFRSFGLMNLVRMNGSVLPPQDFREYMPEHTCRPVSDWSCITPQQGFCIWTLAINILCSCLLPARSLPVAGVAGPPASPILSSCLAHLDFGRDGLLSSLHNSYALPRDPREGVDPRRGRLVHRETAPTCLNRRAAQPRGERLEGAVLDSASLSDFVVVGVVHR